MLKIAIMGHGVVGSGVSELLLTHKAQYTEKIGAYDIKYILDLRDFPGHPLEDRFTKDFQDIANDDEVGYVVEVMGGLHPAYEFVKTCLERGKHVVTSNKELVAMKGAELLAIAKEKNVNFLFEASVGGGIPIIRPMQQCLAANKIRSISGILNGTTNFILTKMIREKMSFEDALALAQQLGYAERNPAADVEGLDACRKICILASLAFGKHVYPDQVTTEGITKITEADVAYAQDYDCAIKLIGHAKDRNDGKITAFVAPLLVSKKCLLANVEDVFNAVMVDGDATDEVIFYGKGAGKLPTASAVVADVLDCVAHSEKRRTMDWVDCAESTVEAMEVRETRMYFRVVSSDPALRDRINAIFGKVYFLHREEQPIDEIAFISDCRTEKELFALAQQLKNEGYAVESTIRVADFA